MELEPGPANMLEVRRTRLSGQWTDSWDIFYSLVPVGTVCLLSLNPQQVNIDQTRWDRREETDLRGGDAGGVSHVDVERVLVTWYTGVTVWGPVVAGKTGQDRLELSVHLPSGTAGGRHRQPGVEISTTLLPPPDTCTTSTCTAK